MPVSDFLIFNFLFQCIKIWNMNYVHNMSKDSYKTSRSTVDIELLVITILYFSFSLSVAIGNMDPGRDSIIYRMTSTRIKKDN